MNAAEAERRENVHNLSRGKIARLADAIGDPVMLMISKTDPDTMVVVTDVIDRENYPVVVTLKPDGKGYYMNVETDANVVLSGYGKKNFDVYLTDAFADDRMLMVSEEKSRQLRQIPGIQCPNNLPQGDFTDNIARFAERVKGKRD